ncbi:YfiR family protein [Sphingopyxis alaskensis]|uniref:YfiR family protein n=1 Tax=Sphingopyxis alaskensis TaxID=117207 RepID=UPI00391BDDAE
MLASLLLIGAVSTTPQMSVQAAAQSVVEDGGMTQAVNRMVGGIASYVRWPSGTPATNRHMCVVGTPRLAPRMAPDTPGRSSISVRYIAASAVNADCDILFLGRMPVTDRRQLIAWVRGRPVLTITDDDAACLYGAMFCLSSRAASLSFSVNLDAIARGPLKIDPRVLRIGAGDGGAG